VTQIFYPLAVPANVERFLSQCGPGDYDAIVSAACEAWNRLLAEAGQY
jgi:hypothetical protein